MEAKIELSREVEAEHEEEKVVEWGEISEETKGNPVGFVVELGGGRTNWP